MLREQRIRILQIDDDEDDYLITRVLLGQIEGSIQLVMDDFGIGFGTDRRARPQTLI